MELGSIWAQIWLYWCLAQTLLVKSALFQCNAAARCSKSYCSRSKTSCVHVVSVVQNISISILESFSFISCVCACVHVCENACVHEHVRAYVCVCVSVYVCVCVRVYILI